MANIKKWFISTLLLSALQVLFSCPAFAYLTAFNYLDFETGYRWDKLDNRVILYGDTANAAATSQIFKNINSYQIGASGKVFFCNPLFIKAKGHYGWICNGTFDGFTITGNIDGRTWDVNGGVGYLFCMHPCWGFAPAAGYAYDKLSLKAKNVVAFDFVNFAFAPLNDIDVDQMIRGPWFGFEFLLKPCCCLDFNFGYELHKGRWRGSYFPETGDFGDEFGRLPGFASKRIHNHFWGHVFQWGGIYKFCRCWNIGIDLTYQCWKGQSTGHYERTITPTLPVQELRHQLVIDVDWYSFSSMIHIGCNF